MMKRASAKPRTEEKELELINGDKIDKKYVCTKKINVLFYLSSAVNTN